MARTNWFRDAWKSFNRESDEEVFNIIWNKYYGLFQLCGLYPKLDGFWAFLGILHLGIYVGIIAFHWFIFVVSIPKMQKINFVLFSEMIHYLVLATLTIAVLVFVFSKRPNVARFHRVIHGGVYDYKEDQGEVFKAFNDEIMVEWKKLLIVPFVVTVAASSVVIFGPIFDNYGTFTPDENHDPTVKFNIPVPMYLPFSTENYYVVLIVSLLQVSAAGIAGLTMACGSLGYVCLTQTVTREFRILLNAVDCIHDRATTLHLQKYGIKPPGQENALYQSNTFNACLDICYKKLHEHHLAILSLADDMSAILGFPNIIAFGGGPLIIGMALLSTTISGGQLPGTTITALVLCVIEITYMYLFSALGQRVTDLSADFRTKLYNIKWYYCRKSILMKYSILQVATKTPYTLYAPFKFMPSNLETFGSVMNSAYSLYNLMLAMN